MVKVISALPIFFLLRGPSDMWVVPALLLAGNAGHADLPLDEVKRAAVLVPDGRPPPASQPMPVPQADQL